MHLKGVLLEDRNTPAIYRTVVKTNRKTQKGVILRSTRVSTPILDQRNVSKLEEPLSLSSKGEITQSNNYDEYKKVMMMILYVI